MFLNRDRFRIAFRLVQSKSLRLLFGPFERIGIHITAADFYSPIPVVRRIPEAAWAPFRNMPVPLWDEVVFNGHLNQLQQFYPEYVELLNGDVEGYDPTNQSFCPYDAQSYWGMIRSCKPRRIVEIGSGWSTRVGQAAILRNRQENRAPDCSITVIDPYAHPSLELLPDVTIMRQRLEDTDYPIVEALEAGDFLFIDSSHAVRFGNDVFYEYLHIIPFLKPGVIVHVHDIFLPHQYPKNWLSDAKYFWAEQYLLLAFLMFNNEFEVLLPMHHLWDQQRLDAIFPKHEESPGGFWMRRICPVGD